MNALEIIHLRASGEPLDALGREIRDSVAAEAGGAEVVTLYRRHGLETDLAVHVRRQDAAEPPRPSRLALSLASSLRAYGLVEHTLWIESR